MKKKNLYLFFCFLSISTFFSGAFMQLTGALTDSISFCDLEYIDTVDTEKESESENFNESEKEFNLDSVYPEIAHSIVSPDGGGFFPVFSFWKPIDLSALTPPPDRSC